MAEIERDNSAYKKRYAQWAGRPDGAAPDYERCCKEVFPSRGLHYQCTKKRGYGPGGAYCKQHDPGAVKARTDAADERYRLEVQKRRYEIFGRTFFNALEQIAAGHNDARGLAQEVIDKFKAD